MKLTNMRPRLFSRSLNAIVLVTLFAIAAMPIFAQHDHSSHTAMTAKNKTGVLLLAHGGKAAWNDEVSGVAAEVGK